MHDLILPTGTIDERVPFALGLDVTGVLLT